MARQAPEATNFAEQVGLTLRTERLGALPLINHFADRLGLAALLDRHVPTTSSRCRVAHARALGVLVRSILVEREPLYRQQETVTTFASWAFGLEPAEAKGLRDDQIGRALDRLFDADRGSLLTDIVVAAQERFGLVLDELHNDSTTVSFAGQYVRATGRSIRGKRGPWITYGFSKDHRPDLKQLLFVLTTAADGGVPVQFRCEAGSCADVRTHIETWEALRRATGSPDFLYVADSKLCAADPMNHIDEQRGRFVTVLPRSRREDRHFREWIQKGEPEWDLVRDRPHPQKKGGPRDRWWVWTDRLPSREGWPLVWVRSTLLALRQQASRRERLARAGEDLDRLNAQISGPRPRLRAKAEIAERVGDILRRLRVRDYLRVEIERADHHEYRQTRPGRPGPRTKYRRVTKKRWRLVRTLDPAKIAFDKKSDGMYPLLTNDPSLSPEQVFDAHKRQPDVEKRFAQTKGVLAIAPVLLKNEARIEALFFAYFLALMLQALIERELRRAMAREKVESLPIYPEERHSPQPTGSQVLRLFGLAQRHVLQLDDHDVHAFEHEPTDLQSRVLALLGVPESAYARPHERA
ncbi:MAG: IS1634 family transposase [bacterium]|nr:IS1634 family transposase [bacterium]